MSAGTARWVAVASFSVAALGCEVMGPDDQPLLTSLSISVEDVFADLLEDVTEAGLRIEPPEGEPRDTIVPLHGVGVSLRAPAILRPDETRPGTSIEIYLLAEGDVVFHGRTTIAMANGSSEDAAVRLYPLAILDVGPDQLIAQGDTLLLSSLNPIVFPGGARRPSADVTWSSSNSLVVQISGGRAVAQSVGTAALLASWAGQYDALTLEVADPGTIVLSRSAVFYHVGPGQTVLDEITVSNGVVGDVGQLSVFTAEGNPWLEATLTSSTPPTSLVLEIDGTTLPPGGATATVVVSSSEPGVADATVLVDARGNPPAGADTRTWSPFCIWEETVFPDMLRAGCIEIQAWAWTQGDVRRVTLDVRNLLGSRGDSLDTAIDMDLAGFGIVATDVDAPVQLLGVRTKGAVGITGAPAFALVPGDGHFWVRSQDHASTVLGCRGDTEAPSHYRTCVGTGYTGVVSVDFEVADTTWSLATAVATMDVRTYRASWRENCYDGFDSFYFCRVP